MNNKRWLLIYLIVAVIVLIAGFAYGVSLSVYGAPLQQATATPTPDWWTGNDSAPPGDWDEIYTAYGGSVSLDTSDKHSGAGSYRFDGYNAIAYSPRSNLSSGDCIKTGMWYKASGTYIYPVTISFWVNYPPPDTGEYEASNWVLYGAGNTISFDQERPHSEYESSKTLTWTNWNKIDLAIDYSGSGRVQVAVNDEIFIDENLDTIYQSYEGRTWNGITLLAFQENASSEWWDDVYFDVSSGACSALVIPTPTFTPTVTRTPTKTPTPTRTRPVIATTTPQPYGSQPRPTVCFQNGVNDYVYADSADPDTCFANNSGYVYVQNSAASEKQSFFYLDRLDPGAGQLDEYRLDTARLVLPRYGTPQANAITMTVGAVITNTWVENIPNNTLTWNNARPALGVAQEVLTAVPGSTPVIADVSSWVKTRVPVATAGSLSMSGALSASDNQIGLDTGNGYMDTCYVDARITQTPAPATPTPDPAQGPRIVGIFPCQGTTCRDWNLRSGCGTNDLWINVSQIVTNTIAGYTLEVVNASATPVCEHVYAADNYVAGVKTTFLDEMLAASGADCASWPSSGSAKLYDPTDVLTDTLAFDLTGRCGQDYSAVDWTNPDGSWAYGNGAPGGWHNSSRDMPSLPPPEPAPRSALPYALGAGALVAGAAGVVYYRRRRRGV
jgi:hypothetical protein